MAHLKTKIAEYGIIINKQKHFLMLKFSKETNSGEKWIFPGGRLDKSENPKKALIREIKEETNLDVTIAFPSDVTMWGLDEDHRYAIFFICKLNDKQKIKLSHEHQEYKWFSFEELDKINYHDISFKTVLLKAKGLLNKIRLDYFF